MNTQTQIQQLLLKYLLPDCLKPQYDGMTAWELAGKILEIANQPEESRETQSN